jgi:broad specificity phosphatase PhoE
MKHIYCVRHAESESNVSGIREDGQTNLTQEGYRQAESVATRFKNIPVDVIIASPMHRAKETAAEIQAVTKTEVEILREARERAYPTELLGVHRDNPEAVRVFNEMRDLWIAGGGQYSDEEGFEQLYERAEAFTQAIGERAEKDIVVVSHGFFMRFVLSYVLFGKYLTAEAVFHIYDSVRLSNTGIIHYTIDDEGIWRLHQWNDDAHLG